jgi:hypothetical protein
MGSKLYLYGGILLAFILLGAAVLIEHQRVKTAKAEGAAAVSEVKLEVSNAVVAQGKQNVKAQKKQTVAAQKDQEAIAPIDQQIKDLDKTRFFNDEESTTIRALLWHYHCAGVQPLEKGCSGGADPSVLLSTGQATPVSIREFLGVSEAWVEQIHRWEEYGQCIEESMKQEKK